MGILVNRHSKKNILFLLIIFITALLLRVYNINFEDYWFDEQASFWVSDPNIPLGETLERGKNLDRGSNMVFNLIFKLSMINHYLKRVKNLKLVAIIL